MWVWICALVFKFLNLQTPCVEILLFNFLLNHASLPHWHFCGEEEQCEAQGSLRDIKWISDTVVHWNCTTSWCITRKTLKNHHPESRMSGFVYAYLHKRVEDMNTFPYWTIARSLHILGWEFIGNHPEKRFRCDRFMWNWKCVRENSRKPRKRSIHEINFPIVYN